MRDLGLRARGHVGDACLVDELDVVGVDGEARAGLADVVRDDQIALLGDELRLRVLDHVVGLRREADEQRRLAFAPRAERGEQVGVRDEIDLHGLAERAALDLVVGDLRRPVVGDRRGHHDDVSVLDRVVERPLELRGALDVSRLTPTGGAMPLGPRIKRDLGTAALRGGRDRGAHLAGAAVADEPHRIDRLVGRTGGDDDLLAREILRRQHVRRGLGDVGGLREPARPGPAGTRGSRRPGATI